MREFIQAVHPKLSYISVWNRPSADSRRNLVQVIVQPEDRDEVYQFSQATKIYLSDVAFCLERSNESSSSYRKVLHSGHFGSLW